MYIIATTAIAAMATPIQIQVVDAPTVTLSAIALLLTWSLVAVIDVR
jgi:hypothetical protein